MAKKSILILDDEDSLLDMYSLYLKKYLTSSLSMITIKDGRDALRILRDSNIKFDLLITDIIHPGITCFELIDYIKQHSPKTKTVIISAACGLFSEENLKCANAYFNKPIDFKRDYINEIRQVLRT